LTITPIIFRRTSIVWIAPRRIFKIYIERSHARKKHQNYASWTKGGVGRALKITSLEQRAWLNKVAQLVKPGESLIPSQRTYKQQLYYYKTETTQMGLCKLHGLRHAYAQRRYRELTTYFDSNKKGLISPIEGGKQTKQLSLDEKILDRKARRLVENWVILASALRKFIYSWVV
jgi:hypothetical protein